MKKLFALVAGIAFSVLALGAEKYDVSPPAVRPDDTAGLRDIWQGCVAHAIRELDDHISTASDIAAGVQNRCQDEYDALNRSFHFSPEMLRKIDEERLERTKELAVILVLQIRAIDRAKVIKK